VLHRAGLPVPYALRTDRGDALRSLAEKPALLQPRLSGKHITAPNPHHCAEVGRMLARLHLATRDQILERRSDRGLDWMQQEGPSLGLSLGEDQLPLLRDGLAEIAELKPKILALPRANLHADLFRDNVLFDGNHLTGVIDFYNACSGPMLYDLAIAVNDWCSHPNGELDEERSQALLAAYSSLRRFTPAEAELWRPMLRVACVRFWLSRLIAAQRFAGQSVLIKDPDEFGRLLQVRQRCHSALPFAF
jgi:homoserine kinase type II